MKTKRFGAPKAKKGEMKAQWGKLPHANPDFCFCWGEGVDKRDANYIYTVFGSKQLKRTDAEERQRTGMEYTYGKTLLQELEERGFDLTTLKFSIQMKKQENPEE